VPATIVGSGINVCGAMQATNGFNTWAGSITLGADQARIGAVASATLVINGVIDSGANDYGLAIRSPNTPGTVILNAPNTYLGNTTIVVGMLKSGCNNCLPSGTALYLGNNSDLGYAVFDLSGYSQKVAGLANVGVAMGMSVTNSSAIESTFTVSNDVANSYTGRINGNITLVKAGQGILILRTNNLYTGTTRIVGAGSVVTSVVDIAPGGAITSSVNIIIETNAQLTLETTANVLNDNAQVTINSGSGNYGKLYLTSSVNETVASLVYDGVPQASGTYGSSGSSATTKDNNRYEGSGILTVGGIGSSSWNADSSGDWSDSNKWLNSIIATGAWSTAYFTNNISVDRSINQDANPMNIGNMYFGSPNSVNWYVTNGTINMTNSSVPTITVTANSATFSNTINSFQGIVKAGSGTLVISGVATCGVSTTVRNGSMTISSPGVLKTLAGLSAYVGDLGGSTGALNVTDIGGQTGQSL
jgi:autotransporter-associated beta strand protein